MSITISLNANYAKDKYSQHVWRLRSQKCNIDLTVDTDAHTAPHPCIHTHAHSGARDETLHDVTGGTRTHPHAHVRRNPRDVGTHITKRAARTDAHLRRCKQSDAKTWLTQRAARDECATHTAARVINVNKPVALETQASRSHTRARPHKSGPSGYYSITNTTSIGKTNKQK